MAQSPSQQSSERTFIAVDFRGVQQASRERTSLGVDRGRRNRRPQRPQRAPPRSRRTGGGRRGAPAAGPGHGGRPRPGGRGGSRRLRLRRPGGPGAPRRPDRGRRLRRPPPALAHGAGRRDGARLPLRPHRDHPAPRGTRRAALSPSPTPKRRPAAGRTAPPRTSRRRCWASAGAPSSSPDTPTSPPSAEPAAVHLLQTARERGVRTVLSLSPVALGGPGQPLSPADLETLLPHVDLLCGGGPGAAPGHPAQ